MEKVAYSYWPSCGETCRCASAQRKTSVTIIGTEGTGASPSARATYLVSGDRGGCGRRQHSDSASAAASASTAHAPPALAQSHADVADASAAPSPVSAIKRWSICSARGSFERVASDRRRRAGAYRDRSCRRRQGWTGRAPCRCIMSWFTNHVWA